MDGFCYYPAVLALCRGFGATVSGDEFEALILSASRGKSTLRMPISCNGLVSQDFHCWYPVAIEFDMTALSDLEALAAHFVLATSGRQVAALLWFAVHDQSL